MKATPHNIIDFLQHNRHSTALWGDAASSLVPELIDFMVPAVTFDFGELRVPPEHKDFALDLVQRGLFALPYPTTTIMTEVVVKDGGPGVMHDSYTLRMHDDGSFSGLQAGEILDAAGKPFVLPITVLERLKIEDYAPTPTGGYSPGMKVSSGELCIPITNEIVCALTRESDFGKASEVLKTQAFEAFKTALGAVVMLMSKGVETTRHEAPAKLNKARAAKGKPLINDRFTVKVNLSQVHNIDGESIRDHTRGSPRMHWRRGHFRTLHRGDEAQRVVPVAPALIGANENADPIRKQYVVGA